MKKSYDIILFLFIAGVVALLSACTYSPELMPESPVSISNLSGSSWEWKYSFGGGTGDTMISIKGDIESVNFGNDSIFSHFRNDTLAETANFSISYSGYSSGLDSIWILKFANKRVIKYTNFGRHFFDCTLNYQPNIIKDSLWLDPFCPDMNTYKFIKLN
jgi:hypothetical protein